MDAKTQAKLDAAGKIAFGAARIGSGIMTATGHGIIGGLLKKHHNMPVAFRMAQSSIEAGHKSFCEGLADWKKASQ
jgi:hypothetical protein